MDLKFLNLYRPHTYLQKREKQLTLPTRISSKSFKLINQKFQSEKELTFFCELSSILKSKKRLFSLNKQVFFFNYIKFPRNLSSIHNMLIEAFKRVSSRARCGISHRYK